MNELKPCPFCGGGNIHEEKKVDLVYCRECGCEFHTDLEGSWNTRPIEDKLNARIAELEAHIAALEEAAEIEEWDDFPNFPEPPEVQG